MLDLSPRPAVKARQQIDQPRFSTVSNAIVEEVVLCDVRGGGNGRF